MTYINNAEDKNLEEDLDIVDQMAKYRESLRKKYQLLTLRAMENEAMARSPRKLTNFLKSVASLKNYWSASSHLSRLCEVRRQTGVHAA